MNRITDNKIVLVTRPTRLAELVARFNTVSQARFYVEKYLQGQPVVGVNPDPGALGREAAALPSP